MTPFCPTDFHTQFPVGGAISFAIPVVQSVLPLPVVVRDGRHCHVIVLLSDNKCRIQLVSTIYVQRSCQFPVRQICGTDTGQCLFVLQDPGIRSVENLVPNDDDRCDSPHFQICGFKRGVGITPIKVDVDLLPNYCPHEEKTFLSVPWANVVEKARSEFFGAHSASFDQLRWYSEAVMEHNPGTYINIDCDEHDNRFEWYFISFKACIDGFKHCRPLLFLDGTFLKGRFKGNLLTATTKDGNRGLFPIAFAIIGSENTTNWSWFLQHLWSALDEDMTLTFISDRHVGLIESMPIIFPTIHHAFCLQHLQRNLRDKLKYMNNLHRIGLIAKFNNCAYAPTVTVFEDMVGKFTKSGKAITTGFLQDLPPQHWANAYFRGNRYGEMCSNAAKSFNNWIFAARHLPITRLVDSIRTQIM
ncbi:hypothetical protein ACSBR2_017819 [Camellia fascicularis]